MLFAVMNQVNSDNVEKKLYFITKMTIYLEQYFKHRDYGEGVKTLYIGVQCSDRWPDDEPIDNLLEKKYYKKRKELIYDILLDYQTVIEGERIENQAFYAMKLLNSIEPIFTKFKIPDFDVKGFKRDLHTALAIASPDFIGIFGDLSKTTVDEMQKIFENYIQEYNRTLDKNAVPHAGGAAEKAEKEKTAAKEELQMQPVSMNATAFWRLIEKTKHESGGEQEKHEELLIEALSRLSYPDIGTFHAIYNFYHQVADRPKLITAAGIIEGFLSDDGFEYFRAWLIGEGEKTYKRTLANPDNLADVVRVGEFADFECLMAVAIEAAQRKHERDKEEYWLTYGYPEEYELSEEQMAECQTGIVFDPELDNQVFGWAMHDRDEARFQAMRTKAFPRLIAKCEKA